MKRCNVRFFQTPCRKPLMHHLRRDEKTLAPIRKKQLRRPQSSQEVIVLCLITRRQSSIIHEREERLTYSVPMMVDVYASTSVTSDTSSVTASNRGYF
ncbi:hypothetical protein AVEN_257428-1 [Araneus ventricosus]|uniref:Uncharacterized protein n=1 Tax=Araneus ventricosus TaxID=182803 RepID=A0A4Y2TP91_ARAVE|nr:hypothetical protein AVEN_257428-1 [Araneus ventricosus]